MFMLVRNFQVKTLGFLGGFELAQTVFCNDDSLKIIETDVKICYRCNEAKKLSMYSKNTKNKDGHQNYCKACLKKYDEKRYSENVEKFAAHHQEYKVRGRDVIVEGRKRYYQTIKEKQAEYYKGYWQTSKGKEVQRIYNYKRKNWGYNSLNEYFPDSEYHHLHRDFEGNVDDEIGVFIPKELHRSVFHNCFTWQGMNEMNKIALEWYISIGEK